MKIIRWGAVAATALFVLMNAGAAVEPDQAGWVRVAGAVLALAGATAAVGLAAGRPWGWLAVTGVGALNCLGAIVALVVGGGGFVVGMIVGGLGLLLGVLARPTTRRPVTTS